jgi:hypothetical protein
MNYSITTFYNHAVLAHTTEEERLTHAKVSLLNNLPAGLTPEVVEANMNKVEHDVNFVQFKGGCWPLSIKSSITIDPQL